MARNTAKVSLAPPQPSPLAPGYKLDRYELLCPIAEGGMASVWIARQTGKHGFQKLVAIKTILPKFASDPSFQQMFLDEVRIASRIEHAHVTQILDVGEQHGVTYLVMEYVDGDALSKVHRAARTKGALVPAGTLLRVMADVCGGLHAAHDLHDGDGHPLGVVHRDVSPQNILVSTKGLAKLIDFGIAKAKNRLAEDTSAGQLKGKVRYMAPEQALGNPVDRRADIWAVGAVIYHLLSGRAPFEGENEVKTLFLLTSGRPPTPMRGNVHPAVSAVVRRALSHAPDERFPTAAAMQEALEGAIKEADLVTTTATVSGYLATEVGDRAEKRKAAIALGLSAAEARERYEHIMESNTEKSNGGTSLSGARAFAEVLTARADRVASDEVTVPDGISSASKSATGQTIGSASVSIVARDGARGRRLAIVVGTVGLAVTVLAAAGLRGARSKPAAELTTQQAPVRALPPIAFTAVAPEATATPLPEASAEPPTLAAVPPAPSPPPAPDTPISSPTMRAKPALARVAPRPPSAGAASTAIPSVPAHPASATPPSGAVPRVNDGF
jgi:serine/threonine protein kinase